MRIGHSTGYHGFIAGTLYGQLPQGRDDAFSNRIFEESNNHGRVFGPHRFDGRYIFIAAFSREQVNLMHWPAHRYESFNAARDGFARLLAGSLGLAFFVYVLVTAGMISGLLPVVGVPMPLLSYGGTSAVSLLAGMGIVMAVRAHRPVHKR